MIKYCVFCLLFLASILPAHQTMAKIPDAEILETKVLCHEPGRYIGWPTIMKTRSGELVVVFSGNRDDHVCPYGITQMVRSSDNGKTWSLPVTINNTPLDDRDAGIIQTKADTWVVSWFTSLAFDRPHFYKEHPDWKRHAEKLGPETRKRWLGSWIRRSEDNGKTWGDPIRVKVSAPHGPIQLRDGRLLYIGSGTFHNRHGIGVEESRDDGKTWQVISEIPIPPTDSLNVYYEPHVVELKNGKLVAMFRYQPRDLAQRFLRQSESTDGGRTWTITHKTPIWGYPPHLIQLKNGWVLVVYGVRKKPYSERACISKDGGRTWDVAHEITLTHSIIENGRTGDLGYPASVQLDDGSIWTVYYEVAHTGEKPSLMATHWKLK